MAGGVQVRGFCIALQQGYVRLATFMQHFSLLAMMWLNHSRMWLIQRTSTFFFDFNSKMISHPPGKWASVRTKMEQKCCGCGVGYCDFFYLPQAARSKIRLLAIPSTLMKDAEFGRQYVELLIVDGGVYTLTPPGARQEKSS